MHAAIVGTAIAATQGARTAPVLADPPPARIYFPVPPDPVAPSAPTPQRPPTAPVAPGGPDFVLAPIDVPSTLPPIPDRGTARIDPVIGLPVRPSLPGTGTPDATASPAAPFGADQVERPARIQGNLRPPRYPEILRRDRTEGAVLATYVVDTLGRVEPESFRALTATHPLFEQAVRSAVLGMRFRAAEVGGQRVRQLVEQRFVFRLAP
jgi:TonB family protein